MHNSKKEIKFGCFGFGTWDEVAYTIKMIVHWAHLTAQVLMFNEVQNNWEKNYREAKTC